MKQEAYEQFQSSREIARAPDAPPLTDSEVAEIGCAVFMRSEFKRSDILFVFGASSGNWEMAARLYREEYAPLVLVSGRTGRDYYATGRPNAHRICDELVSHGVPRESILVEDRAGNTLENVRFGIEVLQKAKVEISSVLFFCKSHHSGRARRTLERWLPYVTLACATYDEVYDGMRVREVDWWLNAISRNRVYGEYLRIQRYSARGDIAAL